MEAEADLEVHQTTA